MPSEPITERAQTPRTSNAENATAVSMFELLEPITRIGVETELSRYPVHNLAKKGAVNIQITKRRHDGVIDLKWEVSYSDRYGQARQQAYKLDTIVVNRRIDEEGRPLPKFIKIGSLNDLCKDLGLSTGGKNKAIVKKGMLQNASAFISAKLKYRTSDGGERTLEAGFTRYSVVFTGEKLPDGREADAIYIVLNEPYREVLNNAPIRPLNYGYLKSLGPSAQRFYEIISSRVYAAIRNKNSLARISYSEFCTYSALTRHMDHENFRVQMSKVHRPHLKSGYITRVTYEPISSEADEDGPDWMMCYKPGPRAQAEYMTFARKNKRLQADGNEIEVEAATPLELGIDEAVLASAEPATASMPEHPLEPHLISRGVSPNKARTLLASTAEGQRVMDQLEWADQLLATEPKRFKNPAGFYVYVLSENVTPPPEFESSTQRAEREQARKSSDAEYSRQAQLRISYEELCHTRVEKFTKGLTSLELKEISARKRQKMSASIQSFSQMTADNQRNLIWNAVKAEVKPRVELPSFEEFVATRQRMAPVKAPKRAGRGTLAPDGNRGMAKAAAKAKPKPQQQALLGFEESAETGKERNEARNYLLTGHPDQLRFHKMLDEGRYEEFNRESEKLLAAREKK